MRTTAADCRRAELRRKLRQAEDKVKYWATVLAFPYVMPEAKRRMTGLAKRWYAYWSDIARILRRTLREDRTRRKRAVDNHMIL